ncbi:MAG: flagellar basal-body rod protein FlgF [Parvularculaceae bacterium]
MDTAMIVGLSRQMTLRRALDVAANNIANQNTIGFKAENLLFEEYLHKMNGAPAKLRDVALVLDSGVMRDMRQGALEETGAPLDVAIDGDGFFQIETDDGLRYTRNGHFTIDDQGRLVTRAGNPVLDEDGREIQINQEDGTLAIASDGTISTEIGEVARLGVYRFESLTSLKKIEGGLFESEDQPEPVETPNVRQGMLEASNVKSIVQMTRLIDIMRSYQSATRLIDSTEDLTKRTIRVLGQE